MTSPRPARRLVEWFLEPRLADALIGDLDEIFAAEVGRAPLSARLNYCRRAAGALWHLRHRRAGRTIADSPGDGFMSTLLRDFARGLRLFTSQPAFSWAAVVTLALAIGANTLIFTIANVLVLKPLPFANEARLGWILTTLPGGVADRGGVSLPEYATFRDEVSTLTGLAAWRRQSVTLRERDQSERVLAQMVIGDLQALWGLHAVRGRTLSAGDEQRGAPHVATLSHRFWNTRFGGADDVIGRDLLVEGAPHTIVGVLAPDIELGNLSEIDLWIPYTADPALAPRADRGWRPLGRLADGATLADVDVQVAAIAARLEREHPATNRDWRVRVGSTRQALGGVNTWLVLALLAVVVGLLLLLACANVMNLLIARLIGRRQELAVRTALGATRGQVVRQIVSESVLLGLAGGLLGCAVAAAGLRGVHAVAAEPFFQQLAFDVRVMSFALVLSFLAPLAFSILPTLRVLREDVRATLIEGSTRSVGSARAARGRSSLVVLQVTLAVTLLIVAALVVQSMQAVVAVDPGYDQSKLLMAQIDVAAWKVPDDQAALRLRQRVVDRVRQIPGVQGAALASHIPALQLIPQASFDIVGRPAPEERLRPSAGISTVSTDYFGVFDIPILAGRGFQSADASQPGAVAVISAETARRFWPAPAEAIGSTLRVGDATNAPIEATIVGVARNLANAIVSEGPAADIYLLDEHHPSRTSHIVLRADAPGALATSLRIAISEVDPDLPVYQMRTVAAAMADENSSNQLLSGLFAAFAMIAILLAMAGLYGVMSYAVSQRSGEIAVRMALGAPATSIARQVIGQSVKLAAIGVVLGVLGAYAMASMVASLLFGVTASDPVTYLGVVVLTLIAAVIATWLPMRRAATIDPLESLRHT